jgi:hypothetical protein
MSPGFRSEQTYREGSPSCVACEIVEMVTGRGGFEAKAMRERERYVARKARESKKTKECVLSRLINDWVVTQGRYV